MELTEIFYKKIKIIFLEGNCNIVINKKNH